MATTNSTPNYSLSQYVGTDIIKFLTNYNQDMAAIDTAVKAAADSAAGKVPLARTIAGLALSGNITLAQLIAAGLASGTNGDANNALKLAGVDATAIIDGEGNALNALKLGGVDAASFPQISSGEWTPTLYGETTAGSPAFATTETRWVKVGGLVYITGALILSAVGGMAGIVHIGGVPFAASAWVAVDIPLCDNLTSGYNPSKAIISTLSPNAFWLACLTDTGYTTLDASRLTDTARLRFSGWYPTT